MPDGSLKRRRGRPRTAPSRSVNSSVTVWLKASDHDALIKLANQQEKSISGLVRDVLTLREP